MVAPIAVGVALEIAKIAAPGFVKWLSGSDKAAEVAGKLIDVAQNVTQEDSPDMALKRLQADPALAMQMHLRSIELENDLTKLFLADRQDARKMTVDMAHAGDMSGSRRKDRMVVLDAAGLIFTLVAMLAIGYLKSKHSEAISDAVFGALLAQLSTFASYFGLCLRDAHQFEFGSSRGSEMKNSWRPPEKKE